jgi:hypothetical protein
LFYRGVNEGSSLGIYDVQSKVDLFQGACCPYFQEQVVHLLILDCLNPEMEAAKSCEVLVNTNQHDVISLE